MAPVKGIQSIPWTSAPRKGSGQRQTLQALKNLPQLWTWRADTLSRLIHFIKLWSSSICHFSDPSNIELFFAYLKKDYLSPNLVITLSKSWRLRISYRNAHTSSGQQADINCSQKDHMGSTGPLFWARSHCQTLRRQGKQTNTISMGVLTTEVQ